jgi:hypothetical protein
MPTKKIRHPSKTANTRTIVDFLNAAFKDYLAARVLLVSQLPCQAAVLASTAIEKYCKAILAFRGNQSRGHLKAAHLKSVRNWNPSLFDSFNQEFLQLLQKCYQLRYIDDLADGFNIVLASREFLAELDFTAISLQSKIYISDKDGSRQSAYDHLVAIRDPRLLGDNHILSGQEKQVFITAGPELVYELRQFVPGGLMEVQYSTKAVGSDGHFLRSGFTPQDNSGKKFKLAFESIGASDK